MVSFLLSLYLTFLVVMLVDLIFLKWHFVMPKKKKKKNLFWCWWPVSVSFNDRARPWLTFNVYLLDSPSSKNILVFFKKNLYWKLGQGCHFSSNGRRYSFNFIVLYAYFLRVLFCIIFLFIYFRSVGTNGSL